MDAVFGLVCVCIVCIFMHLLSGWWFQKILQNEALVIDEKIDVIDQGLGMLAMKLMDPDTWRDILSQSQPEFNPLEAIFQYISSQNSPSESPELVYSRSDDGRFNGAQESEEIPPEIIEGSLLE